MLIKKKTPTFILFYFENLLFFSAVIFYAFLTCLTDRYGQFAYWQCLDGTINAAIFSISTSTHVQSEHFSDEFVFRFHQRKGRSFGDWKSYLFSFRIFSPFSLLVFIVKWRQFHWLPSFLCKTITTDSFRFKFGIEVSSSAISTYELYR